MHRHVVMNEFTGFNDPLIPDDESLLIQLCGHLFRSGFLYDDASEEEQERGEGVLRDFFDQGAEVFRKHLPRKKLIRFTAYLKGHGWSEEHLRTRLHQRIIRGFERLSHGSHHQFNVCHTLKMVLKGQQSAQLQDFLLFLEAYHFLLLRNAEEASQLAKTAKQKYTTQDLLRMRKELKNELEGKQFVGVILKEIGRQRGVSIAALTKDQRDEMEKTAERITFVRPSKKIPDSLRPGKAGSDHSR